MNTASNELVRFMVQTHAEQLDLLREKMNEFKESLLATSHSLDMLKSTIASFDTYVEKIEIKFDKRMQDFEDRIKFLESNHKFVQILQKILSNKFIWIAFIFLMFCVDKNDIIGWFNLIMHR